MAGYSGVGSGFRILILILLIAVLILGGLIWFDYLGLIDARQSIAPVFRVLGLGREEVAAEDSFLLDRERLNMQIEALSIRSQDLDNREQAIKAGEEELNQMIEQLKEREQAQDDREKVFNERLEAFENRRVNLKQNAVYLVGMPPEKAKDILLEMEDQDIIDIFRIAEEQAREAGELSLVSYWLSLMPPKRAAVLQRKMARKTGG